VRPVPPAVGVVRDTMQAPKHVAALVLTMAARREQ